MIFVREMDATVADEIIKYQKRVYEVHGPTTDSFLGQESEEFSFFEKENPRYKVSPFMAVRFSKNTEGKESFILSGVQEADFYFDNSIMKLIVRDCSNLKIILKSGAKVGVEIIRSKNIIVRSEGRIHTLVLNSSEGIVYKSSDTEEEILLLSHSSGRVKINERNAGCTIIDSYLINYPNRNVKE